MKVLIIGSGPIVVGQACEFDYAGTQACKTLKEEGCEVILLNSNPASIMTDPGYADKTYIEEMNSHVLKRIIEIEKPDALLPTLGGQSALNLTLDAWEAGILQKNNVKLIGISYEAIKKAENRKDFKKLIENIGLEVPKTIEIESINQIDKVFNEMEFPVIIRTSYTLGGRGSYSIHNKEDLIKICQNILYTSNESIQIEEYLVGWKEYELEVVRDKNNNCIVICAIENFDPMGIHTGDSITVAPAQTLSDKEYQRMREASFKILEVVGVETGGANVQFAVNPKNDRMVVIEMNPRVSRSSALASKVTGYPIAKIATKLALGYTLDQLDNQLLGRAIPASFEPTIDYIATKIPKFNFNKFPYLSEILGTQMQSVGEVIGIGRNFQESLMKAISALEKESIDIDICEKVDIKEFYHKVGNNFYNRIEYIFKALYNNFTIEQVCKESKIDPWFIEQINKIVIFIKNFKLSKRTIYLAKRLGLSDRQVAKIVNKTEEEIKNYRKLKNIIPTYKKIDSCSAEFNTEINCLYSTYEEECEYIRTKKEKIVIIGSGANRIGQGIEFDYSCVQAIMAAKELEYETIVINSNPETVSTDFDISDRLYLEPLTGEHVLNVIELEKPIGTLFQFGGQTAINVLKNIYSYGIKVLGTSYETIDLCEDRNKFKNLLNTLNLKQINSITINTKEETSKKLKGINFPIILRPSYIISGSYIKVIKDRNTLIGYLESTVQNSHLYPLLVDEYLEGFKEVEVDGIYDGKDLFIAGIMEQLEPVGIHSGDSACIFPPFTIKAHTQARIKEITKIIISKLNILGLFNIQFAIKGEELYIIEVNPRVSRTIPYLSKSLGCSLAKIATKTILGNSLKKQGVLEIKKPTYYFMKKPVFSNVLCPSKIKLGPEMLSTGEKMLIGKSFDNLIKKSEGLVVDPICLQEVH